MVVPCLFNKSINWSINTVLEDEIPIFEIHYQISFPAGQPLRMTSGSPFFLDLGVSQKPGDLIWSTHLTSKGDLLGSPFFPDLCVEWKPGDLTIQFY